MSDHSLQQNFAPKRSQPAIAGVAAAPLVGLKAQLQRAKQGTQDARPSERAGRTRLGVSLTSIKNKRIKNCGVKERAAKDVASQVTTESDKLAASRAALDRKSRLYDAIVRGEASPEPDCEVDFSMRSGSLVGAERDRRRSPSPYQYSDDTSPRPATRDSPTYEPVQPSHQAATHIECDGNGYDSRTPDVCAPFSKHERAVLARKQEHHDAFEARRQRLEAEEELDRERRNIIKEKVATVQQATAVGQQAGTSQQHRKPDDMKRRKALLEQAVAKKVKR